MINRFRREVYQSMEQRGEAGMDLIDGLSSKEQVKSPVSVSESALLRYTVGSLNSDKQPNADSARGQGSSMSHLTIHLFGRFQVKNNHNHIRLFRSNKVRALLAYLVHTGGHPVSRGHITELLWDGYTRSTAQNSLRQSLTNLRHTLAPFNLIEASYRTVCFRIDHPQLWCDLLIWQQMLQDQSIDRQCLYTLAPFVEWGFLAGLPAIDSAPFQLWRSTQAEKHRRQLAQLQLRSSPQVDFMYDAQMKRVECHLL